jgi:hypothetical protein
MNDRGAVGWAKERSDVPTIHQRASSEMVGTLRFAHPTALRDDNYSSTPASCGVNW